MIYNLGDLLEIVYEKNNDLEYGLDDIVGVTIEKELIPTKANLTETKLNNFIIVRPNDFVYNPRTHGKKIGLGFNNTKNTFISSWNNNTFRVKPSMLKVLDPYYLYLCFCRDIWDKEACFNSWGSSTVVLLWENFCNMKIKLPTIEKQKEIVNSFNIITKRIELLNEINGNLEKMLCYIYKESILNHEDEFEMKNLIDIAIMQNGYSYSSEELVESNIAMATIKNFEKGGGFRTSGYKEVCPTKNIKDELKLKKFDVIVAHTDLTPNAEILGNVELVYDLSNYKEVLPSMDLVKVSSKTETIDNRLLYVFLKYSGFKNTALQHKNGTTVLHLEKDALRNYVLLVPKEKNKLKEIENKVIPIIDLISLNTTEIRELESIKNSFISIFSRR